MKHIVPFAFIFVLSLSACKEKEDTYEINRFPKVKNDFPEIYFPEDNEYTPERWQLGKALFYDPILSIDSTISCGTCHKPENAFATNNKVELGVKGRTGTRNSPSIVNVAYAPYFLFEGGVPTLEMQVLVPIQEHNEFANNIVLITEKLQNHTKYQTLSNAAFGRNIDPFVITRAIANFERSLISSKSRYDEYTSGNKKALSKQEILGMELFFSTKTNCSKCHSPPLFTNYEFANNGLSTNYQDSGRVRLTSNPKDRDKFKVPSLRNISVTFPYMHDGSIETLENVISHYNSGGAPNPTKSDFIKPLHLTLTEQNQLIAFLETLTDYNFINNPLFQPK